MSSSGDEGREGVGLGEGAKMLSLAGVCGQDSKTRFAKIVVSVGVQMGPVTGRHGFLGFPAIF